MQELVIATYNIRNTADRYEERKELLKKTIKDLEFDLLGVQEVNFTNPDQTEELFNNLQYSVVKSSIENPFIKAEDPPFRIDGNCLSFKKNEAIKIEKNLNLILSDCRNAQATILCLKSINKKIGFVNTHLHHIIPDTEIRLEQIQKILNWISDTIFEEVDYVVIVGKNIDTEFRNKFL